MKNESGYAGKFSALNLAWATTLMLGAAAMADWVRVNPFSCEGGECDVGAWRTAQIVDSQTAYVAGYPAGIAKTTDGGGTWTRRLVATPEELISALDFVNSEVGWVSGSEGRIFKTTNSGASWTEQIGPRAIAYPRALDFIDASTGWVSGDTGILHTTNGGATWVSQSTGGEAIYEIRFANSLVGWALGNRRVLRTTNGGQTWATRHIDSVAMPYVSRLLVFGADTAWVSCTGIGLCKTADGGVSWIHVPDPSDEDFLYRSFYATTAASTQNVWRAGEKMHLANSTDGGVTWKLRPQGGSASLRDIRFWNPSFGIAVGHEDVILVTTDSGKTWRHATAGNKVDMRGIHFQDALSGWMVGDEGKVLRTTDGGITWRIALQTEYRGESWFGRFDFVRFSSPRQGWIVGHRSYRTTDGGDTWALMHEYSEVEERSWFFTGQAIDFIDSAHGWVLDARGGDDPRRLFRTRNAGATWDTLAIPGEQRAFFIDFVDSANGWIVRENGIFKTTNGGATWNPQLQLPAYDEWDYPTPIQFLDASLGWVVWANGEIRKTTDGGATWSLQPSGTTRDLSAVRFLSPSHGFVAGGGITLKTTNGGESWETVDTTRWIEKLYSGPGGRLFGISYGQIYEFGTPTSVRSLARSPEPIRIALDGRTLRFTVPRAGHVEVTLFSASGKRIVTLANRRHEAGAHSLQVPRVAPGRYLIVLREGARQRSLPVRLD